MFEWQIKIQNLKDFSPLMFITMQLILFLANKIECGVTEVLKFSVSGFLFSIVIFSFVITGNVSKQIKVKVLFYAWMHTLYKYFISVFIFLLNMMSDWNSFKSVKHLILLVIVRWPTLISSPGVGKNIITFCVTKWFQRKCHFKRKNVI